MAKKAEADRVFAAGGDAPDATHIDRNLALELVRVTEAAALAASRLMGRGDEKQADQAAVDAMRRAFDTVAIQGTVVIGEGERDEAPMLFIGEKVGSGGMKADIALDPLEGTTITAKGGNNALSVVALAEAGNFLNAPDVYMDKIAIGPGYPAGTVDIDAPAVENIANLAKAKGVPVSEITACILDRPRHARLIEEVRATGAAIRLIGDGDVAGVIHTTDPDETGIDIYLGIGGAPEGVLAAAALRCIGGQMQGRLQLNTDEKIARTRGVDELGEVGGEAHDARPRRRRLRGQAGTQRRRRGHEPIEPHALPSSLSKRSSARSSGQSNAGPGSVFRPGATSL